MVVVLLLNPNALETHGGSKLKPASLASPTDQSPSGDLSLSDPGLPVYHCTCTNAYFSEGRFRFCMQVQVQRKIGTQTQEEEWGTGARARDRPTSYSSPFEITIASIIGWLPAKSPHLFFWALVLEDRESSSVWDT